jgi:hypothetical protein
VYLVSGELLARGGSGTQGKISDTAKRKQLVVGFIVIMVIGMFGGDIDVVVKDMFCKGVGRNQDT